MNKKETMILSSPTRKIRLRNEDSTGNGWFGASRGSRKHKGTDYIVFEGEEIFACCSGKVRLSNVYKSSTKMKLIEITGTKGVHKVRVQQMYVLPSVKNGQIVEENEFIGYAQDVAKYHNSNDMKPHVHISVWKNGLLTDPEPIIIDLHNNPEFQKP